MRRRSIFGIIVLSIITCGIYYLIAWVQIFSDINYGARENDTAITDLLLSIVTMATNPLTKKRYSEVLEVVRLKRAGKEIALDEFKDLLFIKKNRK